MKLVRVAVAAALSASALVAVQASAAPLPCKLITDPAGDATLEAGQANDSSLDITSIDFGADTKRMTLVIRVAKASMKSAVLPVGSYKVTTDFSFGGDELYASIVSDGTTVSGNFGEVATGVRDILTFPEAKVDTVKNELRITIPGVDFPGGFKKGMTVSDISTSASSAGVSFDIPGVGTGSGGGFVVETAEKAGATHTVGAKNCVVVGK